MSDEEEIKAKDGIYQLLKAIVMTPRLKIWEDAEDILVRKGVL